MHLTRNILPVAILILFVFPALCVLPAAGDSVHDKDFFLYMELKLEFETSSSGSLSFYFGTHHERPLSPVANYTTNVSSYDNKFLSITHGNFTDSAGTDEAAFRALLNTSGGVAVAGVQRRMTNVTTYFGLSFSCRFDFDPGSSKVEYRYLDFIRGLDLDKYSAGDLAQKFLKSTELIEIHLVVDMADGLSYSKRSDGLYHQRTITGESVSQDTTVTSLNLHSNKFIIDDDPLKAPFTLFAAMVVLLCFGFCALILVWRRNRFQNVGLVLPFLAILVSLFTILQFFMPHISFYGMNGYNIYLGSLVFIGLVGLSRFINPRLRFKTLDEERKAQAKRTKKNSVKMPKIIYVDKFVERPVVRTKEQSMDPYKVLGVAGDDPFPVVKKAYLKLAKEYHPDKYSDSPGKIREAASKEMEQINNAFEMISEQHGKK